MKDIIIIGAGPAGMTAAIYVQRAGMTSVMIDDRSYGGNIVNTPLVENYPGMKAVSGAEYADNLYQQAKDLGAELVNARAIGIEERDGHKAVLTTKGDIEGKAVIIATGVKNRKLGLENEEKLTGAGISFCATCDGNFFRNRTVCVIGGGNTALEDAELLAGLAQKVYLIHRRSEFRGNQITVDRLKKKENVEFVLDSVPEAFIGDWMVEAVRVRNVKTGETREIKVNGIFEAVGQIPDNEAFRSMADLDEQGYLDSGEDCLTRTPGVFAAGDARRKSVRQLTTAAADGSVAALAAVEYIHANY